MNLSLVIIFGNEIANEAGGASLLELVVLGLL